MPLDTICAMHHTHTDVGFTNDQPIFWEMQYRFIDDALRLIERHAGNPPESRFRWTVETTCGLDAWLKTASGRDIDRLIAADCAMPVGWVNNYWAMNFLGAQRSDVICSAIRLTRFPSMMARSR